MTDPYTLPDAPPIPDLRFRPFAGVGDADKLRFVQTACAGPDGVDPLSTTERTLSREDIVRSLDAMTQAGGRDRTILAEVGDEAVGYNRLFDWIELDGTHVWLHVGWVVPAWRGRGLATALLHWTERRIRELAEGQGNRWEFAAKAGNTEVEATALLLDALRELRRRKVAVARLHTVAEFPTRATDLYQSLGFRVLKEFPRYRKAT